MSDRRKKTFLFLSPFTDGRTVSRRDLELQDSQARAHAAVWSSPRHRCFLTARDGRKVGGSGSQTTRKDPAIRGHLGPTASLDRPSYEASVNPPVLGYVHLPISATPDPFSTYPNSLNSDTANYAQYFQTLWTGLAVNAASPSQLQLVGRDASLRQIIQICMQNQLAHDAFTAAIAMRMTSINKVHGSKTSADRSAGRAISALLAHISSGGDLSSEVLVPIMFLAGYETYTYNFAGCRTHLTLLRELNAHHILDEFQLSYIHNLDVFCASATLCTPIFPVEPPDQDTKASESRHTQFSGSAFANHRHVLGPNLTDSLIPMIIDCTHAAKLCRQCFAITSMSQWNSLIKGVVRSCSSITSKLLCCIPATPEQEACIIALLTWLSHLPMGTLSASASEVFRSLIPSREHALSERLQQWGDNDLELCLWTAAIGLIFSVDEEATEVFVKEVSDLRRRLGLGSLETERLLDSYIWLDSTDLSRCGGGNLTMLLSR